MPLGAAVVFSSIAGRFGNAGQTDYSAANDLLCKHVSRFRSARSGTRGIAIDWTAWSGIGMASRGSIPAIMKQAGIDMLPPEVGIPVLRHELSAGAGSGEVVVAGSLGIMTHPFDESGGVDTGGAVARGIMTGRVVVMDLDGGLTVETTLDPAEQPFLHDHQIGGTPVLPGVMGIEAMVEAATALFPDRFVGAIEDVHFDVPFKFYRGEPRTVRARTFFSAEGDDVVAQCRIEGERALHGRSEPERTTHFRARVRLLPGAPHGEQRRDIDRSEGARRLGAEDIYRLYFHGPAYRVLETSWRQGPTLMGLYAADLPANHTPPERATVAQPRWIELCFQTAGIMELVESSKMGLPYQVEEVKIHRPTGSARGRVVAVVTAGGEASFDADVVDEDGMVLMTVHGYRTMALPDAVEDNLLKPLKEAIEVS
jgi:hypothetical protein